MSEYTAKALIEPRDYRVVFVIQKIPNMYHVRDKLHLCNLPPFSKR